MIEPSHVLGVVLAGGQSRRMGGADKTLLPLAGKPLVQHVAQKLAAQTKTLAINTNAATASLASIDDLRTVPTFSDTIGGHIGPLAGVHAGMVHAQSLNGITHIATAATDTPFFPTDLVARLCSQVSAETPVAIAMSDGNRHPVFALWPIALADRLAAWLATSETYKVVVFARKVGMTTVDFTFENGQDPFFNINTPDDLSEAEDRLAAL